MTSTRIEVDDDQFAALEAIRTHHGVNWRGMLIQGAERLEAGVVFPSEHGCSQLDSEEEED
ncbi:hypothetical protein ACFQE8_24705 [Salinirubellus sp. GCM10025818]|jgi:hypothetical protein|uniref:hypothetical protein n=1 Tax=Salinirubellus TaxID=2162630 RepID=UPI0030CAB7A5